MTRGAVIAVGLAASAFGYGLAFYRLWRRSSELRDGVRRGLALLAEAFDPRQLIAALRAGERRL